MLNKKSLEDIFVDEMVKRQSITTIELNETQKRILYELLHYHVKHNELMYDDLNEEDTKWLDSLIEQLKM